MTRRTSKAIVSNGGSERACGWCKDRWVISWQITPVALAQGMADPDPATRKRVFRAMMTMRKIDIAGIEAALYFGALIITGLFTLMPGRLIGSAVWGGF